MGKWAFSSASGWGDPGFPVGVIQVGVIPGGVIPGGVIQSQGQIQALATTAVGQ